MRNFRVLMITLIATIISTNMEALNCSVDIAQFIADEQPFVDVNLRVDGSSCVFTKNGEGMLSSSVLVQIIVKNEAGIEAFRKYKLVVNDQSEITDLLDLQRFVLDPKSYDFDVSLTDLNDTTNVFQYKSTIVVQSQETMKMSNALVLSKADLAKKESPLNRNGIYMETQPYMKIGDHQKAFQLYQEVYRTQFENDKLIYKVEISKKDIDNLMYRSSPLVKYRKIGQEPIVPMLTSFDISELTSGTYSVITSVIDVKKNVLYQDDLNLIIKNRLADIKSIKDYNKIYGNTFVEDLDSAAVVYALKAIIPITNYKMMSTLDYIIKHGDLAAQKYYLFYHWDEAYPGLAEAGYNKYMEIARAVDKDYYSNVGHGFQTDRGYIYLKYGKPSKFITVVDEANAPPYEIWYYYYLEQTQETDVRFIFYDPLQVNNFELLHSTCYAERKNPAWETLLYKFNEDERIGHTIIATEVEENWGRRAKKLFNDF